MRDGDKAVHHGKGVLQAIGHVNNDLAPAVIAQGLDVTDQTAIDEFMIKSRKLLQKQVTQERSKLVWMLQHQN